MSFLLVIFLFSNNYNGAISENISRRNLNETFDINIGAGYGVGLEQSSVSSSLPKSTTTINHNTNYLSKILSDEIMKNKTYIEKNHSPRYSAIQKPNHEFLRDLDATTPIYTNHKYNNYEDMFTSPTNHKEAYRESDSAHSASNQQNFQIHSPLNIDGTTLNVRPNVREIQTMINNLEDSKYSKVVQVLKVPAVYEIHLQSNVKKNKFERDPPKQYYQEQKPTSNIKTSYEDYIKWLNDYYNNRETTFHAKENNLENHQPINNVDNYSQGNLLHFGKTDISPYIQELDPFPVSTNLQYQAPSTFHQNLEPIKGRKNQHPNRPPSFRKHKEISNMKHQPQAIYEVPAPYLGNSMKHRPLDKTKTMAIFKTQPNYKPKQTLSQNTVNVYSTLTPKIPYGHRIKKLQNHNLPFNNQNPQPMNNKNLVYGKAFERVLSPHGVGTQRRIAHPFSNNINILHPTHMPKEINMTLKPEDIYFTTQKCSTIAAGNGLPPADNVKKRKSKTSFSSNRRNLNNIKKVPDMYVVITRIHESVNSDGDKK